MRVLFCRAPGVLLLLSSIAFSAAQNSPAPSAGPQPGYTLHIGTRVVLTDVTVTDRYGNPIRGLEQKAFHIFDNGRPQQVASFIEHTGKESVEIPAPRRRGVVSNSYLLHPPPVFSAILIDLTTISIVDQMYLAQQLDKFVESLPAGEPVAIYARAGDSVVQMQDITSDHALLHAALRKAIPHLRQPGSWGANDLQTLQQMIAFLRQYPGRKDLIWFSGGSNLALLVDATGFPPFVNMQPLYDELESTRIAVYPVDARGLTVSEPDAIPFQHMMMEDTAEATGGRAFFNNNGLQEIASRIVNSGAEFYTLTYSPHEQKFDNKWHKVKIKVEGQSYQLSYRRGYYDDGNGASPPTGMVRTVVRADGTTAPSRVDLPKQPIIFSASVAPSKAAATDPDLPPGSVAPPPKKNETTYTIHYALQVADLIQQNVAGKQRVAVGFGAVGVNRLGAKVARKVESVSIGLDVEKLRANPDGVVGFDEQINLPVGDDYVYLVTWDEASGRFGTVEVPVTVPKRVQ